MPNSTYYNSEKSFVHGTVARDVAEPLPSFDAGTPAMQVKALMDAYGYAVVGVREEGFVTGCLDRACLSDALADVPCRALARPIDPAAVVSDTELLPALVAALNTHEYVFVRLLGAIGGYITRRDLQDPPVRMWLFGMINTYELRLTTLIARRFAGEEWADYLSPARLNKARTLQEERRRRNNEEPLLRCLQFADKLQIVARDEHLRAEVGFVSRKRADFAAKSLERLRNNLAHAQDIVETDWDLIFVLAERLETHMRHLAPAPPAV